MITIPNNPPTSPFPKKIEKTLIFTALDIEDEEFLTNDLESFNLELQNWADELALKIELKV